MSVQPMSLSLRSYGTRESAHAHEFHQIVLPVEGAMEMRVGDIEGEIAAHSGVVVVKGTRHAFRATGRNCFVVFDVPPAANFPESIVARAVRAPFFAIDEPLGHLARYVFSAGPLGEATRHAAALLANSIGRQLAHRGRRPAPIARALAEIETRYAEPLRIAELARLAGMSVGRFHERFRDETGTTPADRLAAIRLDHAAELLRTTRMPIAEIALAVGFSEQSALTRSFRRRRGITPAALRRAGAG